MREPTPDEKKNREEQRQQDNHCNGADSHPGHRGKTVIFIRKQSDGLETEREQSRHDPAHGPTDECVDERLAQTAFALHHSECFGWTSKHHCQGLDKRVEKPALLPVLPRQTSTRRNSC